MKENIKLGLLWLIINESHDKSLRLDAELSDNGGPWSLQSTMASRYDLSLYYKKEND